MVLRTKPDHIERPVVVRVVGFRSLATYMARLRLKPAVSNSVADSHLRSASTPVQFNPAASGLCVRLFADRCLDVLLVPMEALLRFASIPKGIALAQTVLAG